MNKQDLIRKVAADAEVTQRQASVMIDSMLSIIMNAVASGEKVQLMGFGVFEAKQRAARLGRNIQTGEEIEIPETTVPVFKAGVEFKEAVGG